MSAAEDIKQKLHAAERCEDHGEVVRLAVELLNDPASASSREVYLSDLAYAYEQLGRFSEAADAMQEAVEAGFAGPLDLHCGPQSLIAELLQKAGRLEEADAAWEKARVESDDYEMYALAGRSYREAGRYDEALTWLTEGLDRAFSDDDLDVDEDYAIPQLTKERARTLAALGITKDELQRRGDEVVSHQDAIDREWQRQWRTEEETLFQSGPVAVTWLPEDQFRRAQMEWPNFVLEGDGETYEQYRAAIERVLAKVGSQIVGTIGIAEIDIDTYVEWCEARGDDPDRAATRARYAIERQQEGTTMKWPPERNQPCWCGSGRKYKKCCQT